MRAYAPLGKRVTLAVRGSVGFLFPSNYEVAKYLPEALPNDPNRSLNIEETYFRGFTSGGPNTNRGYPVRGIAPYGYVPFLLPASSAISSAVRNNCTPGMSNVSSPQCALPIAGLTLWEASVETRFQVSGPFSAALFCDAGDVSPNQLDIRLGHLHLSCGAGVRYDTPVGPIRLDIGYRIQPLQVLPYKSEVDAGTPQTPANPTATGDPVNGLPPQLFSGIPIAIAFGIGEAF